VDSIRELRAISAGSGDESPAGGAELFHIVFNLGNDVEHITKTITHQPKQIENADENQHCRRMNPFLHDT
jgi:hypothetical protein